MTTPTTPTKWQYEDDARSVASSEYTHTRSQSHSHSTVIPVSLSRNTHTRTRGVSSMSKGKARVCYPQEGKGVQSRRGGRKKKTLGVLRNACRRRRVLCLLDLHRLGLGRRKRRKRCPRRIEHDKQMRTRWMLTCPHHHPNYRLSDHPSKASPSLASKPLLLPHYQPRTPHLIPRLNMIE